MLKHALRSTIIDLAKNKFFAFINIFGLSIGMTAFLLIVIFVRYELSYDDFHENKERVFRLQNDIYKEGELIQSVAQTYPRVGPALQEDYPEVADYCRLFPVSGGGLIRVEENFYNEENLFFADPSFLEMFSHDRMNNLSDSAFHRPNTAVLTKSVADRYFGETDPIDQTIVFNWFGNKIEFKVDGVVKDPPQNTHLKFNILFSYKTLYNITGGQSETSLGWNNFYTYIMLTQGSDANALEEKFTEFVERHLASDQKKDAFLLQPISSIHLESNLSDELEASGNKDLVNVMTIVAFFILIVAWINYINISIARSSERAKEVAVRKLNGATKQNLIYQFMSQSFILNFLAFLLTLVILFFSVSSYEDISGIRLSTEIFTEPFIWGILISLLLLGTLASGLYPAFIISAYQPVSVLGGGGAKNRKQILRSFLVTFQYAIAGFLIVCVITVYNQIEFLKSKDLAFNIDEVLVVKGPKNVDRSTYSNDYEKFSNLVSNQSAVKSLTSSGAVPGQSLVGILQYIRPLNTPEEEANSYYSVGVDHNYFDAYGIKLLAGRNYVNDFKKEETSIIFNEAGIQLLGYKSPEEALNKRIHGPDEIEVEIIGVVENSHQLSPRNDYYPTYYRLTQYPGAQIYYSIELTDREKGKEVVDLIESQWSSVFPGSAFEYFFLKDFYEEQYGSETQLGKVFTLFTGIAIVITCLGFFAMVSFSSLRRSKEIAIRKVLGSSDQSIMVIISSSFLKLIVIGNIIAWPLAYLYLDEWLNDFAFKQNLGWFPFLLSLVVLILISLITVGFHIWNAARKSPVKSLRYV